MPFMPLAAKNLDSNKREEYHKKLNSNFPKEMLVERKYTKYTAKGIVNGKEVTARIYLVKSQLKRPSRYQIEIRAHCVLPPVKTVPTIRFLLEGRWWERNEEQGIWQVRKTPLTSLAELDGNLPGGEYLAATTFENLVGGRHILTVSIQGTRFEEVIPLDMSS